jgi:NDP-sugar pyrophosphorylase family protein
LSGPIYIGKDAEIMEGSVIRGPFALCEGAVVKMAASIWSYYSRTLIPELRRGNLLFQLILIKGMMVLGNSVLGEWCNIGADSNNSKRTTMRK